MENMCCSCKATRFCAICINSERVVRFRNSSTNYWEEYDCCVLSRFNNEKCFFTRIHPLSSINEIYENYINFDDLETCKKISVNGLTLIPEFITEDEENFLMAEIDASPWISSQSGRRKQDYGPRVNFKQQKVKIGDFKGMPRYVDIILKKMSASSEPSSISNFKLFELCNLEYDSNRLSSIDFHKDDSWIWGDRLISVSLLSDSIMSFEDNENRRILFVPIPRRSLLCIGGEARNRLNHGIFPHHIQGRRVVITMREPSAEFQIGGSLYNEWGMTLQLLSNNRI